MNLPGRITAEEALKASTQAIDNDADPEKVAEVLEVHCYPAISRSMGNGFTQAQVSFALFEIYTIRKVMIILQEDGFWVTFDTTGRYHDSAYLRIDWSNPTPKAKC